MEIAFGVIGTLVGVVSLAWSIRETLRARRLEDIRDLLGEKETVAYAAARLLREPKIGHRKGIARVAGAAPDAVRWLFRRWPRDFTPLFDAIICACVFESSDRARALLYDVLSENLDEHEQAIWAAYNRIDTVFRKTERYNLGAITLTKANGKQTSSFDLATGQVRLRWVRQVLEHPAGNIAPPARPFSGNGTGPVSTASRPRSTGR